MTPLRARDGLLGPPAGNKILPSPLAQTMSPLCLGRPPASPGTGPIQTRPQTRSFGARPPIQTRPSTGLKLLKVPSKCAPWEHFGRKSGPKLNHSGLFHCVKTRRNDFIGQLYYHCTLQSLADSLRWCPFDLPWKKASDQRLQRPCCIGSFRRFHPNAPPDTPFWAF